MTDPNGQRMPDRPTKAGETPLKLDQFLPYRLNLCAGLVSQAVSRIYAERYQIGVPEWRVLATLGEFGMMTAKAIGRHSHMHKTKVSRAVALLERRKFISRKANRADLREAFLSLTPAGREVYNELVPAALDIVDKLMQTIEPDERVALDRALSKLVERSKQLSEGVATAPLLR
jgi:DNA-binding MarR family transcriptional regulator